ncbi:MAG: putative secondary metabolism biosynthetic enzyme [Pycnora praestabilis]|nr:MAG: putative secondary metabolism biosynthetic enzyme [Pycnora praestabilis]
MAPQTMKAAQFMPDTKEVQVNEVALPEISDDEILVKMASASLCHSDLMLLSGGFEGPGRPVTLGHEGVGYVERTGSNVKGFKKGDRVHNLNCELGTAMLQGFGCDGMFAEYASVDYHNTIILPESLDMKTTAPLFCAGITGMESFYIASMTNERTLTDMKTRAAYHAVDESELKPGEWLGVVGCGGLGQLAIQYGKAMGFNVIGMDINDKILEAAKGFGADHVFNTMTNKNYIEDVKKATGGGCDAAAVFSAAHPAYTSAKAILKVMGVLMVIGLPSTPLQFDPVELMRRAYRIKSTSTGPPQQMPAAVEFTAKHKIAPQVSFYKLDQINEMIETMHSGKSTGRLAVVF